ncbi:unnamed protein product [Lactuca saligna]|uniref:Uncharacterized protein n=1 Tax=Lactuca saligna TaxID=75948 RepID=A0AA35YTJ2_LACSI|nr:unnamed protein product [Lactuca saligna]
MNPDYLEDQLDIGQSNMKQCGSTLICVIDAFLVSDKEKKIKTTKIFLEIAVCGHYRGKLCHREIELVEALPPPVFEKRMREFAGLISVEGGHTGSSTPTLPSQLTIGVVSLVRLMAPDSFGFLVGVQAEKGTAPIRKRRSLRMMLSLDKETESDVAGLRPRNMHQTVSMAKLLGVIGDVLGDRFFIPGRKEKEVVTSSSMTQPFPFTSLLSFDLSFGSVFRSALGSPRGSSQPEKHTAVNKIRTTSHTLSFEAYASGWAITRDSLLLEDITASEWSSCAHPPATMKLLVGESSTRMASNLLYPATQAFALMFAFADQVFRTSMNETQLKAKQSDSKAKRVLLLGRRVC